MSTPEFRGSSDPDRTARAITGGSDRSVSAPNLELRQGVVTAVDDANARVSVALGADTTAIPDVAHVSNYRPTVDDTVTVLVNGPDLYVLDRVGAFGPSVIAGAKWASLTGGASQTRTSQSYGDLSSAGPSLTCTISPGRSLFVGLTAIMYNSVYDAGNLLGAAIAIQFSGANTISPESEEDGGRDLTVLMRDSFEWINATKTSLYTGLNTGPTTLTMKYRAVNGGTAAFNGRYLWILPL